MNLPGTDKLADTTGQYRYLLTRDQILQRVWGYESEPEGNVVDLYVHRDESMKDVVAARALVYAVARYVDTKPKEYSKEGAMAKLFPTDMAMSVTVDAVQVMGGHGYMREYPVEKMMRDAKILQIYEGTNQIMRNVIGLALNKEYSKKK